MIFCGLLWSQIQHLHFHSSPSDHWAFGPLTLQTIDHSDRRTDTILTMCLILHLYASGWILFYKLLISSENLLSLKKRLFFMFTLTSYCFLLNSMYYFAGTVHRYYKFYWINSSVHVGGIQRSRKKGHGQCISFFRRHDSWAKWEYDATFL